MKLNVYYLDDEEALCENFVDYFSSKDIEVTTFIEPHIAIESIKKQPPDVLFIDYRLPGTTGDEVAKLLDPAIPKFLVTGDIHVNSVYKFEKILAKPYVETEISEIIMCYFRKKAAIT